MITRLSIEVFCLQVSYGKSNRMSQNIEGNLTLLIAYCNMFLNPLIYILHYHVVKRSLINWARKVAANLRNQQPTDT